MPHRDELAVPDGESATRVRGLAFVIGSVIAYAGLWLIGSVFGRVLLDVLSRPGRTLSWYAPAVWTLSAVLIGAVQVGVLWACGVRSARPLILRIFGAVALTAVVIVVLDLLAILLNGPPVSLSFRVISAAAGIVVALAVAGIPVLLSLIPQRDGELGHRSDGIATSTQSWSD
jgi:hypothetical protein